MDAATRKIAVPLLLALTLLVPACTRERPTPEPTPTLSFESAPPTAIPVSDRQPAALAADATEASATETPEPEATPTNAALSEDTFQYTVQPGDTLLSLAIKFETEVETIRELNALENDDIAVGQPLYVPYVEGMTMEGMPPPTPGPYAYTVQEGDTLNAIALRFGADPIEIVEFNNLLTPDSLTVGAQIIIPNYAPPAALAESAEGDGGDGGEQPEVGTGSVASDGQFVHVVQPGQGLFEIASLYGVSPNDIAVANNMSDTNLLRVGQELIIPGVSMRDVAISRGSMHVVQAGESLLGIAIRYGVTVEEILEINNLTDPDSLSEGQELIIPAQ